MISNLELKMSTVTKSEAARQVGLHRSSIKDLITKGLLEEVIVGGRAYISSESVFGEQQRRLNELYKAINRTKGTCDCGCGKIPSNKKRYIQGHDEIHHNNTKSVFNFGTPEQKKLASDHANERGFNI